MTPTVLFRAQFGWEATIQGTLMWHLGVGTVPLRLILCCTRLAVRSLV